MLLKAVKGHDYDNKWRSPGDLYQVAEQYVLGLVSSGYARRADEISDSPQPEAVTVPSGNEIKSRYQRRDMRPVK